MFNLSENLESAFHMPLCWGALWAVRISWGGQGEEAAEGEEATPWLQFLPSNPGLCCSALSSGWSADLCSGLCWPKRAVGPNLHAGSSMAQVPCCCLKEKTSFLELDTTGVDAGSVPATEGRSGGSGWHARSWSQLCENKARGKAHTAHSLLLLLQLCEWGSWKEIFTF